MEDSVVYRYELHGNFVYHIQIPISSCSYCDLFDNPGYQLDHTHEEIIADFIQNRYNEFVVWAWKEVRNAIHKATSPNKPIIG